MNEGFVDAQNNTDYITVPTVDADGSPCATSIGWFAFDGENLVFDDHAEKIHSDDSKRDGRCFITVVNRDKGYSRATCIFNCCKKFGSGRP